jgi:Tfp pilus assembly protein PilO
VTLTTRRLAGLTVAAAAVLLLVWYMAFWRVEVSHLQSARASYHAAQDQITSLEQQQASLKAIVSHKAADAARLTALNAAVPSTADLTTMLNQLHQLATATGIQVTAVNPTSPPKAATSASASGLQNVQITITGTGTYDQLRTFLSSLATMPRTVIANSLSVAQASGPQLTMNLTAEIFYAP